jgi:hypothetical protein
MNDIIVNREKRLVDPSRAYVMSHIVNEDDPVQRVPLNRLFTTVFLKHFGITREQL